MHKNKLEVFRPVVFWWFVTTAFYVGFNFMGYPGDTSSFIGHVVGFVGLFVPYGLYSFALMMFPGTWFSIILFIAGMIYLEKIYGNQDYSLGKKILINLIFLFVMTTVIDVLRFTPFESWKIFIDGSVHSINQMFS